ncbi:hypothetical protein Pint_03945 [Pistacia integerrima]|uniref:Uncharacterized protein n=1 Tax=Pistacia integerrima TaxID=434235 RepID=A0ACC0Z4N9_9ROSI|nr:hypothetical protein Pint_03945 [Pistacia integerrima]
MEGNTVNRFPCPLYTMATYVGPYLIGTFVQYLTGRREFKNEGDVLQVGTRIRAVLVTMAYNKGLTLSCQAKQERTSGEIVNFMTVDAERVGDFSWSMHDPWIVPVQGWEMKFLSKIVELRMSEAGWLKKYLYTSAMTSFVSWGAPTFVSVATVGACMLLGIPLESSKILSALATLKADVMEKQPIGSSDKAIDIADANFSWDVSSPNQTLRDINLKVFHGMRVASGKIEDNILFGKEIDRERATLLATAGYKTASILFNMGIFAFQASTDQSVVDLKIPSQVGSLAFLIIQLLGIIIVMSQVARQVFLVFILVIASSIWYQQYYLPSARELSRLVGVCKAPVIQHFAETISGSTTIRSFDQESRFRDTNMKLMDGYSRPNFQAAAAIQWLCFRLNMLSSITFAFSLIFLTSIPKGVIDPVCIRDLQVRYALHLPVVLRGLTCSFLGGMKTGIVGRTGSGKSTLIQTIFWIVELAAGQIMIDGIDISSIGLHDLRSRLSIIPQDPTMFEGTVRSNLDTLEDYKDEQIWEALDKCQLGDEVRKKEGELDSKVTENGENWSMGQRQLVCLGCLLLKKSKVLVLDEATAFVDTATDNLIQRTLRQHFSDCTVITIAHRITSVIATDMVLLLNNGLIKEYDSPSKLLENRSSSFAQLVAEYTVRSNSSFEK